MKSNSLSRLIGQSMRCSLIVSASLMATSTYVHAQTSPVTQTHQVTRAEVLHELEELESVGYNPSQGDDGDYPADIQEAQRKVEARHQAERNAMLGANPTAQPMPAP